MESVSRIDTEITSSRGYKLSYGIFDDQSSDGIPPVVNLFLIILLIPICILLGTILFSFIFTYAEVIIGFILLYFCLLIALSLPSVLIK
jgi:hypothetical protein